MDLSIAADAIAIVKTHGPLVFVTCIVLVVGWWREVRLTDRIDELQSEIRSTVVPLTERCANALTLSAKAIEDNTSVMRALLARNA